MTTTMVVTIDGPAGAGKSTVAKALARRLDVAFMDTGAMYRALTVKALRRKVNLEDEGALISLAHETHIDLLYEPGRPLQVILDGEDVSEAIRTQEVTNKTYFIARTPGVREVMVHWQREMAGRRSLVGDGRDLGTVVFPQAAYKFYLDADVKVRSQRRIDELRAKGQAVDEMALARDLAERDRQDFTRKVGPLKKADDAIFVDSTGMSVDEVVELMVQHIRSNGRRV
ncbi:MAG: (d)CMP kinase [Candidatus Omnitrophica bacterium]|nr:(d)CMP kinase [Candidatus Omnitrophota bacterium]